MIYKEEKIVLEVMECREEKIRSALLNRKFNVCVRGQAQKALFSVHPEI
jgi:hypothetical protein